MIFINENFANDMELYILSVFLAAALDSMASKTLAEAEKKFPIIKKTPTEVNV